MKHTEQLKSNESRYKHTYYFRMIPETEDSRSEYLSFNEVRILGDHIMSVFGEQQNISAFLKQYSVFTELHRRYAEQDKFENTELLPFVWERMKKHDDFVSVGFESKNVVPEQDLNMFCKFFVAALEYVAEHAPTEFKKFRVSKIIRHELITRYAVYETEICD